MKISLVRNLTLMTILSASSWAADPSAITPYEMATVLSPLYEAKAEALGRKVEELEALEEIRDSLSENLGDLKEKATWAELGQAFGKMFKENPIQSEKAENLKLAKEFNEVKDAPSFAQALKAKFEAIADRESGDRKKNHEEAAKILGQATPANAEQKIAAALSGFYAVEGKNLNDKPLKQAYEKASQALKK